MIPENPDLPPDAAIPDAGPPKPNGFKNFLMAVLEKVLVGIVVAAILAIPFKQGVIYIVEKLGPQPQVPIGTIVAWNGVGQSPTGWEICNGLNGTPNLKDFFLKGVTDVVDAGKTNSGTEIVEGTFGTDGLPAKVGVFSHTLINNPVVPQNYTVIYIMRVK
jgi:hypothetical protein